MNAILQANFSIRATAEKPVIPMVQCRRSSACRIAPASEVMDKIAQPSLSDPQEAMARARTLSLETVNSPHTGQRGIFPSDSAHAGVYMSFNIG